MTRLAVGIDLGGTDIKAGVVDEQGRILGRWRIETRAEEGAEAVLARMVDLARTILAAEEVTGAEGSVTGIGIGSPGPLDPVTGVVKCAPNLPGFNDISITGYFEANLDLPARLDNDANLCALGEYAFGAGRQKVHGETVRTMAAYTLGTGVGGGIVIDGNVVHGARGYAAELGHMTVVPGGWQCGCGNRGCVEAYASATGMVRLARERLAMGWLSSLSDVPLADLTSKHVGEAAAAGDAMARDVVREAAAMLGIGIANLVVTLNPQMVVIGGGAAAMGDILIEPLRQAVNCRAAIVGEENEVVRIVPAELGNDAGFCGGAALFLLEHRPPTV